MNYLDNLTEDEVRYICSVIPLQESISYFKHYPKDFSRVMPGFRATSLRSQEQVCTLLFRSRKHSFIYSFIEKHIDRWMDEIQNHIEQCINDGDNKDEAFLNTLPLCFFADNIGLYFKLADEVYSDEYIDLLSSSIKLIKVLNEQREEMESSLSSKISDFEKQEEKIENLKVKLNETKKKLSECRAEVEILNEVNAEVKRLENLILSQDKIIDSLKINVSNREERIHQLNSDLSLAKDEHQQLVSQIREEIESQQKINAMNQAENCSPRAPKDIDEFKDYLGYNFESIGLPTDSEYFALLKEHLSEILFQGKPIIVSHVTGINLMKCVANTLIETPKVPILTFVSDISEQSIEEFLSTDSRLVCLDNFVGNFNETVLLTLCDKHKDKIIFLTTVYDKTIYFLPDEFMKYCHYLNLNRIVEFTGSPDITEDPSFIEEETSNLIISADSRWSQVLNGLLEDFGFSKTLSAFKSVFASDEQRLCCLLAFDILPYCVDVLQIAPFNISEQLNKYAGNGGRCPYKDLFKRWFT